MKTDPLKRVSRLSSAVADYRYGYDNVSNRTFMQRAHKSGAPADVYQYDNLYQLTQVWYSADATEPAAITTYEHLQTYNTLDPVGNRLEVEHDGVSVSYLPNDGQQLTNPMHRYEQVDGQTLGYDLKGNLLEDGENSYTYDVLNRQISMIGLDSTAEYVYDALGRRVAKVVDGVTTYYVSNTFYQVLEERNGSNQLLARYTYGAGIDEVLTMERSGTTYTYHHDALGSITEVTDTGGSLVERYEYDVYGAASIFDSSDTPLTASAIGNPYLFTARRYDPESGNYYYRARMYSSSLGRFLQMDPLEYEDGINPYMNRFVINGIDPYGMKTVKIQTKEATFKIKINDKMFSYHFILGSIERIEVEIPNFFNAEILSFNVKSSLFLTLKCRGQGIQKKSMLIDLPTLHWTGGSDDKLSKNCELARRIEVSSSSPLVAVVPVPTPAVFPPLLFLEDCPSCEIRSLLNIDVAMMIEVPGPTCFPLYKLTGGKTGTIYIHR